MTDSLLDTAPWSTLHHTQWCVSYSEMQTELLETRLSDSSGVVSQPTQSLNKNTGLIQPVFD